jgi:hypothetical protein
MNIRRNERGNRGRRDKVLGDITGLHDQVAIFLPGLILPNYTAYDPEQAFVCASNTPDPNFRS